MKYPLVGARLGGKWCLKPIDYRFCRTDTSWALCSSTQSISGKRLKEAPVERERFIHDTAGVMRVEYDEGRGFLSSVINIVIVLILPRLSWTEFIVCPSWQNCFGTDHEKKSNYVVFQGAKCTTCLVYQPLKSCRNLCSVATLLTRLTGFKLCLSYWEGFWIMPPFKCQCFVSKVFIVGILYFLN